MGRHRIGRQIVEIRAPDRATAESLADRTSALAPKLTELLERRFDAADDGTHRRIDRLVLTLPPCRSIAFEERLLAELDAALAEALPAGLARVDAIDPAEDALELLGLFLQSGVLPWWADDHATAVAKAVETLVEIDLLAETSPAIAALRHMLQTTDAATRLVQALPPPLLPRLAAHLVALSPDSFDALAIALVAEERGTPPAAAATRVWSQILVAAAHAAPAPPFDALAQEIRIRLAFLGGTGHAQRSTLDIQTMPPGTNPQRHGLPSRPDPTALPPGEARLPDAGAEPHVDAPAAPSAAMGADASTGAKATAAGTASPQYATQATSRPPVLADTVLAREAGQTSTAPRARAAPPKPERSSDDPVEMMPTTKGSEPNAARPSATPHDRREADRQSNLTDQAASSAPLPRGAAQPPASRGALDSIEKRIAAPQPANHDSLFVPAAGIVLLGPFLPDFLAAAGLVDPDRRFVTPAAQHHVVMLLDYLASAEHDPPETRLALAKLIAGLPIDALHVPAPLDEAEAAAADTLLAAVLAELPMLGQLTVEGFRSAWLNRPGLLTVEHGSWLLRIEKRGWDVLLERLPWSIAWLQLPWQPEGIRIEW